MKDNREGSFIPGRRVRSWISTAFSSPGCPQLLPEMSRPEFWPPTEDVAFWFWSPVSSLRMWDLCCVRRRVALLNQTETGRNYLGWEEDQELQC